MTAALLAVPIANIHPLMQMIHSFCSGEVASRPTQSRFWAAFYPLLWIIATPMARAELPDVNADSNPAPDAVLTLHQVHDRGLKNYEPAATDALKNLEANADLTAELMNQAGESSHLSVLTLRRISAIESRCDPKFAYADTNPSFRGYFQMGKDACKDVGIAFSDISEPSQWKKSCEAGRLYLDLNWARLEEKGAKLKDGEKATLTLLYLMHQQGPGAAPALWEDLDSGTAGTKMASANMRKNVGPKALAAIEGTVGHHLTELEFYAYWVGSIDVVVAKITK